MTRESSKTAAVSSPPATPDDAKQLASVIVRHWSDETPFSAESILGEHPELAQYSSVILDLAHEEYRRRVKAGERIAPSRFAARFPAVSHSLRYLLNIDDYLDEHSYLLEDLESKETDWPSVGEVFLGFRR